MTTTDVLRSVARRRWLALVALLATAFLVRAVLLVPGVYYTEVQVYLLAPSAAPGGPVADRTDGLIALAGLVERRVNAGATVEQPVSPDVTLVGMGIREGVLVTVPNAGGQWSFNVTQPVISVQAAGPTADRAAQQRDAAVTEVRRVLAEVQRADGVPGRYAVSSRLVPEEPVVQMVEGHAPRAAAVTALIGTAVTVLMCVHVDRLLLRRRRRAGQAGQPERRADPATVA